MREGRNSDTYKEMISDFVSSLPFEPIRRQELLSKYRSKKGFEFLSPDSKMHNFFLKEVEEQLNLNFRKHNKMEQEKKITMEGNAQQLSVGGMCEMLKERISQGTQPYTPISNQSYLQEITFTSDLTLSQKTQKILHQVRLLQMEDLPSKKNQIKVDKVANKMEEFRREMIVEEDGSLGAWGGKKYEGLGSRNFRNSPNFVGSRVCHTIKMLLNGEKNDLK